jgi:hypothetical protein
MKEVWIMSVALMLCGAVAGQTFSEWFRQKKTQIKYLQEQIATLKAYQLVLEEGYKVATQGLDGIQAIKQDDLDRHSDHFASLKTAKACVQNDPRVQAALVLSGKTIQIAETVMQVVRAAQQPPFEMLSFADYLLTETKTADQDMQEMIQEVLYDEGFMMSDDQRLAILDHLYRGAQLNYRNSINALRKINYILNQPQP